MAPNLDFIKVNIRNYETNTRNSHKSNVHFPIPSTQKRKFELTKEKRNDLNQC